VALVRYGYLIMGYHLTSNGPFNFTPRVKMPVLMVNGRYDFFFPKETTQDPMFRALGTPEKDKRHVVFESGHVPPPDMLIKEVLDWLDRYLGSVR
jgi:eukaryotic-like serine/threonine-protein kinase